MVPPSCIIIGYAATARHGDLASHFKGLWCRGTATFGLERMAEQNGGKKYQVTISGPGVNIDTMTDETVARTLMTIVMGGLTEPPRTVPPGGRQETMTLRDFVASSGARSIPAQILAIAQFVRTTEHKDEFTRDEIGGKFGLAGLTSPADLARDFQAAANHGWIAEDPRALDHFFITKEGHEALRKEFEGV
jgi:hypothetical protein